MDVAEGLYRELVVELKDGFQLRDIPEILAIATKMIDVFDIPGIEKKRIVLQAIDKVLREHFGGSNEEIDVAMAIFDTSVDVIIGAGKGKYKPRGKCGYCMVGWNVILTCLGNLRKYRGGRTGNEQYNN